MPHRFRRSTQSGWFQGGYPWLVASIQYLTICSPASQLLCWIMNRKCFCRILWSSAKLIFALLGIRCHHFILLSLFSEVFKNQKFWTFIISIWILELGTKKYFVRSKWLWVSLLTTKFTSIHPQVQVDVKAKFEDIPSTHSSDVFFLSEGPTDSRKT